MADRAVRRWKTPAAALLAAAGTLALMVATEPRLAMVWDEGYTLGREERVRQWFAAMANPPEFAKTWPRVQTGLIRDPMPRPLSNQVDTRAELRAPETIAWFWPFGREEPHGHPPFYAIVGVTGDVIAGQIGDVIDVMTAGGWRHPWGRELSRVRFGPMVAFSLAAGAIFGAFLRRWGTWPALAAAGAWVLHPHLFALGHYAGYDAILSALWVGAILAFSRAAMPGDQTRERAWWPSAIVFGVLCGWAADTKLTGWFLPLPFIAWTFLTHNRRGLYTLAIGGFVAVVTLYLFNPPWWGDPVGGPIRFLQSNLTRSKTIRIRVMFLGKTYLTPIESLPPYNTLVWTAIATPVGFLALALIGSVRAIRDRASSDPLPILALAHWLFLLTLRALPQAPGHDGVRQFLPAFGCLALVAGVGAAWVVERWKPWGRILVAMAVAEGAASIALMMPVPLSYFSPIIGGLPGAAAIGMEPTYYWDALSAPALERLAEETPPERSVAFSTFPTSWLHLRQTGAMRFYVAPIDRGRPAWYVIQNRPGEFDKTHRDLVRMLGPKHVLVAKFGVPLIWALPYDGEVERALKAAAASRGSP